jgi:2-polyprenyl-3-methyl-5-hydroxy-6-metoxy-1,4-benzoquinol methylase
MLRENELLDLITTWLPPGGQVLDVGCGSGQMLRILAERGISGLGIDPYASNAERCRRLRAEEMDQLTESFDLVYTHYTLHHLDGPQQFPHKVRSVLRPGGALLIVDWIEGARTGIAERYLAPQAVAGWICEAGFRLLREDVRGRSMVIVGRLPPARLGPASPSNYKRRIDSHR